MTERGLTAHDVARAIAENELPGGEFDGATVGLNLTTPEVEICLCDGSVFKLTVSKIAEADN